MGSTPTLKTNPVTTAVHGDGCSSRAVPQTWCLVTLEVLYLELSLWNPVHPSLRPGLESPNSLPLCSQGAAGFSVRSMTGPLLCFLASPVSSGLPLSLENKFLVFTPNSNSQRLKLPVDSETSLGDQEDRGGTQQAKIRARRYI